MPGTQNPTLPNEWRNDITYSLGQTVISRNIIYKSLVNENTNHEPPFSPNYWEALDIYKKDLTVMEHGDYSGDDSFWERDQLYIDSDGWVYANNENTGINVNGRYNLTNEQLQDIAERAAAIIPIGPKGEQGMQGPQGPQGPMGQIQFEELSPEQIQQLKGEQGEKGDSNYDIWKRNGHPTGTEADYLTWLQNNIVVLDTELDINSHNSIENQAVASAFLSYQRRINELLHQFEIRLSDLEDRLKYMYQNEYHTFRFGITENGEYGYIIDNATNVIPFNIENEVQSTVGVENITGIAYSSMAQTGERVNETFITNDELQSASLVGTTSIPTQTLSQHTFSNINTPLTVTTFDLGIGATHTIYENNEFVDTTYNYILDNMTLNNNGLFTNGDEYIEGIKFPSESLDNRGYYVYFDVEPYTSGQTVKYSIGIYNAANDDVNLETFINDNTKTTYKEEGTINSPTTLILSNIHNDQGIYLATHNTSSKNKLKITKIYIS